MKRSILAVAALSVISVAPVVWGTPIFNVVITHDAVPSPTPPAVSATDLINQGQPTLGAVTSSNYSPYTTASIGALNDGTSGAWSNSDANETSVTTQSTDYSVIFNLIGSPTGYSISEINVVSLWSNDFTNQNYSIGVSTVANPSFVTVVPDVLANDNVSEYASAIESFVSDSSGTLASGVTAIQFTFHATPQEMGGTDQAAYREVDVLGTATAVPEPTTMVPMVVTALGLIGTRRRRRTL